MVILKRYFLTFITCCIFSSQSLAGELVISPVTLDAKKLSEVKNLVAHRMKPLSTEDYELQSVSMANLIGKEGLIVCVESQKARFSYPSPYAFMKTNTHMYNLGGGGFCKLGSGTFNYQEYSLKRGGHMKMSKSDRKKIPSGKVTLQFSVNEHGRVEGVKVIDNSTGSEAAEKIATRTLKKYRYRPRVVGDASVSVHGLRQRFSF
ncbi:energy transducer TonB [Pseudoteredinibacter isoporae]|uniref:TonB family protein n=1 Tax=Pseudoteredinibacter isoporae TaxID=570281 RepID=A0A7X0JVV7_9GAMM|nr:TonB family protein [Pseudoteredinibacter isoporae]MBB6523198.1 TonB family protein [Pseudoteredinibacter isoporae]NHO88716.1 TonB family protein [Pseudoteredinibacter isoporae]NIB22593.1 TonB family protein [Pseudoteredinibacter isoporae]